MQTTDVCFDHGCKWDIFYDPVCLPPRFEIALHPHLPSLRSEEDGGKWRRENGRTAPLRHGCSGPDTIAEEIISPMYVATLKKLGAIVTVSRNSMLLYVYFSTREWRLLFLLGLQNRPKSLAKLTLCGCYRAACLEYIAFCVVQSWNV